MIKYNKWCVTCKRTDELTRHNKGKLKNGDTVQYYMCREDARIRRMKYDFSRNTVPNGKSLDKEWCVTCKKTKNLIKYSNRLDKEGTKVQYYMCNSCNTKRHNKWYENGNQQVAQELNRRYRHKTK